MKVTLLVFLGLVTLAYSTQIKDNDISALKKLLVRALERHAVKRDETADISEDNPNASEDKAAENQEEISEEDKAYIPNDNDSPQDSGEEENTLENAGSQEEIVPPKQEPAKQDSNQLPQAEGPHPQGDKPHPPANRPHPPPKPEQGQNGNKPRPPVIHPQEMIELPAGRDNDVKPGSHQGAPFAMPIPVLAFIMSSSSMKAAPLEAGGLSAGLDEFSASLPQVIKALRKVADDVRKAPSLANAAELLGKDMDDLSKVFIPIQRRAAASFFRAMVYGLKEKLVCDLESADVTDCVANRMEVLAKMFMRPDQMDPEVNKMERCNAFVSDNTGGKAVVADDLDCLADGVTKVMEFMNKMKNTVAEAQLTSLLDESPIPKFRVDLDDVADEVSSELRAEFKGIMAVIFRLMIDASDMGEALS